MKKILIIAITLSSFLYTHPEMPHDRQPQLRSWQESFGPRRENFKLFATAVAITIAGTIGTILVSHKADQLRRKKAWRPFWKKVAASVGLSLVSFMGLLVLLVTTDENLVWRKQELIKEDFIKALAKLGHKHIDLVPMPNLDDDNTNLYKAIMHYAADVKAATSESIAMPQTIINYIRHNQKKWAEDHKAFKKARTAMENLDAYLDEPGQSPFSDYIDSVRIQNQQAIFDANQSAAHVKRGN